MESIELSSWAETVTADKIPIALAQLAAVQTTLTARLLNAPAERHESEDVNWLSVDQAAAKLGRSPRWFYRNAKRLPFVKRLSRKVLLVSEQGMVRWIAVQRA
ncbi:hypothetical protein [Candidatus Binatus sp.]|uniref:hypothetical protein n=1 Tax=Candidatus Binatus sp. TaxID=2811406 RepID=UPI003C5FE485